MWQYNYTDSNNDFLAHTGVKGMRWGYSDGKSNGGRKKKEFTETSKDPSKMSNAERQQFYLSKGYDDLPDDWKYEFKKQAEKSIRKGNGGKYYDQFGNSSDNKDSLIDNNARWSFLEAQTNSKSQGLPYQTYTKGTAPAYKVDRKKQNTARKRLNAKQRDESGITTPYFKAK